MALAGFQIGSSPAAAKGAPAPGPTPSTGGALAGFTIGSKAPSPAALASATKVPAAPPNLFTKTLNALGLSPGKTANSTAATMADIPAGTPSYMKNGPVLQARVGENLSPEETA